MKLTLFGAVPVCATNWMFAAVPQGAGSQSGALTVCVIQIALASGALLGGEEGGGGGVNSAMLCLAAR